MERSAMLQLDSVSKQFPHMPSPTLAEVSLTVAEGELLALLGASGCGKTTLLRIVAGFDQPDLGVVSMAGQPIATPHYSKPPETRNIGIVFQDYALFPHLTVAENIQFGLQTARATQKKSFKSSHIRQILEEMVCLVNLEGMESRYPHQLSGGQQQRVALARALAPRPRLILLDEPFSNLDVQVRQQLRQDVRHILRQLQIAAILVTHDQEEALSFADRVGILHQGKLEQIGIPEEVYQFPSSRFVAEFVCQANFLTAYRQDHYWVTELGKFAATETAPVGFLGETGVAMVRQDCIKLAIANDSADKDGSNDVDVAAIVCDRQFLGRDYCYLLKTIAGSTLYARLPATQPPISLGTRVMITLQPLQLAIFPA